MADLRPCPLTGYDLGYCALAAVLRNAPSPRPMADVQRVWLLTVSAGIGGCAENVSAENIPWGLIVQCAGVECVLARAEGLWLAGADIGDAHEPTLEPLAVRAWATLAAVDAARAALLATSS